MKDRFTGENGARLLIEALRAQPLIEHDPALAERFISLGTILEYSPGAPLVEQASLDNDLYLLIDGEVGVVVNGRTVATRRSRESIGEMALIDGDARRSATVVALKPTCALRVSESQFQTIADEFPRIWRAVASVVASRLRQRDQFHRPPNTQPILFLGSSVEGLAVAKHIQLGLKHSSVAVQPWTTGVFGPGGVTIDSLMGQVDRCDFAAFVFGPDDQVTSRSTEYLAPRDNVVFELGLFMGRLDRNRCFIVREHGTDIKIPSDLLGITPLTYIAKAGADLASVVVTVCTELEAAALSIGVK